MQSILQKRWGKSPLLILAVALAVLAAGSALAAAGAGTLVTGGEDGAATAHSAQAPVGSVSATPSIGVKSDVASSQPDMTEAKVSVAPSSQTGTGTKAAVASGGGAGGQLPFTGYLAITVLAVGGVLLLTGLMVRRRTPQDA